MSEELKKLKAHRGIIKGQLTRFTSFISDVANHTKIDELGARSQKLEELWYEFQKLQTEIEIIDSENQGTERESFEDTYFRIVAQTKTIISQHKIHTDHNLLQGHSNSFIPSPNINVKLPLIDLPHFNGSYEDWLTFYEGFKALVLDNKSLNNVQRFYYLLSCLKNDSIHVIQALEVNNDNFEVAWKLLRDRYENKRVIVHSHVKGIYDLPTMLKENHVMLRKMIDTFLKHQRALKALDQPVDTWDTLLIFLLSNKLDPQTKRDWETSIKSNELPNLDQLLDFLKNKAQLLETLDTRVDQKFPKSNKQIEKYVAHLVTDNKTRKREDVLCAFCKCPHFTFKCPKLLAFAPKSRYDELRKLKICSNCLKNGHLVETCRSNWVCKICKKRHNTALHSNKHEAEGDFLTHTNTSAEQGIDHSHTSTHVSRQLNAISIDTQNTANVNYFENTTLISNTEYNGQVLLSTVAVYVCNSENQLVKCRALLDSGSQSNFITADFLKTLRLTTTTVDMPVTGINQAALSINKKTYAFIKSIDKTYTTKLPLLVINKITGNLPQFYFNPSRLNIPSHIRLADSEYNKPGKIDMLLGSGIFFTLLNAQKIELGKNNPVLQHTKLGWLIAGPLESKRDTPYTNIQLSSNTTTNCLCIQNTNSVNELLERFWQVEDCSTSHAKLSNEELECELHFRKHFKQDRMGRCTVQLPLRDNYAELGESLVIATRRLKSMENKLSHDIYLREQYNRFLQEYEDLGHMTRVDPSMDIPGEIYNYLPHHAVVKDSSSTTKVRVVFDASSKTSTGISLNDVLKVGPTIQSDLFEIILRMRTYNVVITADITKMYRQINVDQSQRCLQRIVWRKHADDALEHFSLNTITYGTSSASFLATRTLHQIGLNAKDEYPYASNAILNDFYMDDLISGSSDVAQAEALKNDIEGILLNAGLPLRKWLSNRPELFKNIDPDNETNKESQYIITTNKNTKTLGITWNPESDTFLFALKFTLTDSKTTKRIILSNIATIFDPLGLINPCVVRAKLLLQQLWQLRLEWDEPVPEDIRKNWLQLLENIDKINQLEIPRHILVSEPTVVTLHGFSDASELAFGACIYLVSLDTIGNSMCHLVCSKSRLAPLKAITLPRLELCGALLLAQLMQKVKSALRLNIKNIYFWTDSTIVLSWLDSQPNKWKTFVCNRVSEIQDLCENHSWYHINSSENPADVVSRGLEPGKLKDCDIWWHGPSWITLPPDNWPQAQVVGIADIPEARKGKVILSYHATIDMSIFSLFSNFRKLQRVTAYILRFINNSKHEKKFSGALNQDELNTATLRLAKIVQYSEFYPEIKLLKQAKCVAKNSKLMALNPFLDANGLIRVGGRLKNADIPFNQKYPIVLPGKHTFSRLLIIHEHHKHLHAGAQFLLARLRVQFWLLNGMKSIRGVLRNCLTCFRVKPPSIQQLMGDLPEMRVTPSRAFTFCGIDYAGFYNIKDRKSRTRTFIKCYLCIFVCLATKAVHVELVTDLTSNGFMNAFKRFVSRRGFCKHLYTDNGTNFVGASNELQRVYETLKTVARDSNCIAYFSENHIKWHFIPARSPHFGGMWEAAVKSFKYHIKRVVNDTSLDFEDFCTILAQIEAILNSRPILPLSNDPHDLQPLTPGHFLIGDALVSIPQENVLSIPTNRLSSYKKLQQMTQRFWTVWSRDYLNTLQQRNKWRQGSPNIAIGSLVLVKDDNLAPMNWQLGRVTETHPGDDGRVRVVSIRVNSGIVKRAINKVCPLPCNEEECD